MEPYLDHWDAIANSSDYDNGASDAGFTVLDGGTFPYALSSDYDYFITQLQATPMTLSDTFIYRICTCDSDKTEKEQVSMNYSIVTGAAASGADHQFIDLNPPHKVVFTSNANYIGLAMDFSDTLAVASFQLCGYRVKKGYL